MIRIDQRNRTPIYEQIQQSVENLILSDIYKTDDQLPSVRALSTELAINPNTIQKAYQLLESKKLIYSLPGRGSFIAISADELRNLRKPDIFAQLDNVLEDLWQLNTAEAEVISYVKQSHIIYHDEASMKGGEPLDSLSRNQKNI